MHETFSEFSVVLLPFCKIIEEEEEGMIPWKEGIVTLSLKIFASFKGHSPAWQLILVVNKRQETTRNLKVFTYNDITATIGFG